MSAQQQGQGASSSAAGGGLAVGTSTIPNSVETGSPVPNSTSTTSASSTPSKAHPSEKATSNSSGHSAGEIAGAAVGAAIGGALIAFLVAWLLFRRRRNGRKSNSYGQTRSYDTKDDSSVTEKSLSKQVDPVHTWQVYLPQSADDSTIQNAVKSLFDQVDQHVENFYQMPTGQSGSIDQQALAQIDSGQLPGPIVELLQEKRIAIAVVKHCIAALLIERITPSSNTGYSLLPVYLSSVVPKKKTLSAGEQDVTPQAYSQWKLLVAYLQSQPDKDPAFTQYRNSSVAQLSGLLEAALGPWQAATKDRNALKQHESSMIAYASDVGILILSQPSAFRFRWDAAADGTRNTSSRSFITYPGFWKSTNETGVKLNKPQLLLSPVILRI